MKAQELMTWKFYCKVLMFRDFLTNSISFSNEMCIPFVSKYGAKQGHFKIRLKIKDRNPLSL